MKEIQSLKELGNLLERNRKSDKSKRVLYSKDGSDSSSCSEDDLDNDEMLFMAIGHQDRQKKEVLEAEPEA